MRERDDLRHIINQFGQKEGFNKASMERLKYLEKQLEFTTNENKNLNNRIMKQLSEIDEYAERNHLIESEKSGLENEMHLLERKMKDSEVENSRLMESRD